MMKRQTRYLALSGLTLALASAGSARAQDDKVIEETPAVGPAQVLFSSRALQAELSRSEDLSSLAQQNSALGDSATAYGFAAKSDEANVFLVGALYSEALAFLAGGNTALAADRLTALQDQFLSLDVSSSLYGLISKTLSHVEAQRYSEDALLEMLSLVQPFFEDYAGGRSEDFLILFRAGSWLVDMSLAAAVGHTELLRQTGHLDYIRGEMQRMDAPNGVLEALDEIASVAAKDEISARDSATVIEQVKRIQSLMG
jgi:hypothetical protein